MELETELVVINGLVSKISDTVLTDKFHLDEYKQINKRYLEKIREQLVNIRPHRD